MIKENYAVTIYKEILNNERKRFPNKFWNNSNSMLYAKEITIYLIENILNWNDDDIKNNLCNDIFKQYKIYGMLSILFSNSFYLALNNAYPNRFKGWEMRKIPKNYWNLLLAKEATIWMIEEKLKWSDEQIKRNLSIDTFKEYNLKYMVHLLFNNNIFFAIDNAYPKRFHRWDFLYIQIWNKESAREATIWLIEEKLKWNDEQIRKNLCLKVFLKNGLSGMITKVFNSSPFQAIDNAYPGKFHEWEFSRIPNYFWNKETSKEAIIWLVEEKYHWNDDETKKLFNIQLLKENGLFSITSLFGKSVFKILDNAYPGKFHEWELSQVPKYYWNKDTARKATIWLIEEKLKWNDEQIKNNLCTNTFKENNLLGMLSNLFNSSVFNALNNAYPGKFHEWELKSVPRNFWNDTTKKQAIIWLIEEKLKWDDEQIKHNLCTNTFKENGLYSLLINHFKNSPYIALEFAYPGRFDKNDFIKD